MDNETVSWIEAAQQADDPQNGIRNALVAIAISLARLVELAEAKEE